MGQTVDLTKINLAPKSIIYLSVAAGVVLGAFAIGGAGVAFVKDAIKPQTEKIETNFRAMAGLED